MTSPLTDPNATLPIIRIVVLGDSGVGKTTTIRKLCYPVPQPATFFDFGVHIEQCLHIYTPPSESSPSCIDQSSYNGANPSGNSDQSKSQLFLIEFIDLPGHHQYSQTHDQILHHLTYDGALIFFNARSLRSITSIPYWHRKLIANRQGQFDSLLASVTSLPNIEQSSQFSFDSAPSFQRPQNQQQQQQTQQQQQQQQQYLPHQPSNQALTNGSSSIIYSSQFDPFSSSSQQHSRVEHVVPFSLFGTVVKNLPPTSQVHAFVTGLRFFDLVYFDINDFQDYIESDHSIDTSSDDEYEDSDDNNAGDIINDDQNQQNTAADNSSNLNTLNPEAFILQVNTSIDDDKDYDDDSDIISYGGTVPLLTTSINDSSGQPQRQTNQTNPSDNLTTTQRVNESTPISQKEPEPFVVIQGVLAGFLDFVIFQKLQQTQESGGGRSFVPMRSI